MNIIKAGVFLTALIATNPSVYADVYKTINEEGVVEYSDQPREGAEKIKVKSPQSITLPKAADVFTTDNDEKETSDSESPYQQVVITQPANNSAFNTGNGQVSISSETTPPLMAGHSIQLVIDGTTYNSNKSGSFSLTNVDRGTHQAQVNVINGAGEVLITSETTTFTVHRISAIRPTPLPRGN